MAAHRPAPGGVLGLREAPARVGRDGALRLTFERRAARTVLVEASSVLPLQVLAPLALDDPACVVSILNPTGGVVGGDRLDIAVVVGAGAHACLTTPSATKVYRSAGATASQRVRIAAGADAIVEWVPEHTIAFAGAAFRQSCALEVGDGARAVIVDAFAAGRVARGETWQFSALESALVVRDRHGELLWDRWTLTGAHARDAGLAGRPYVGCVAVVAEQHLDDFCAAASRLADAEVAVAAGVLARRGALARVLAADAVALGRTIEGLWTAARADVLGLPPLPLRKP